MIMDIKDRILAVVPEAVFTEQADLIATVPASSLHKLAESLKNDADEPMDYMRDIVGMDWGESLGAYYYLESSKTYNRIALRAETTDRNNPELPSVSDVWKTAEIKEREVYDFFGVKFIGNPDMRRIFLRDNWVGYPLRKDYDESSNPLDMTNEENEEFSDEYLFDDFGNEVDKKNRVFAKDDYVINIGPQHPSTHGALRLRTSINGEIVTKIDPVCGYIHRGIEKMNESLTYPQTLALTDRLDYLSANQSRHALCMCIEQAMGLEVTPRIEYIRTIIDELQRIDSHLLFFASLILDMGAYTPFFYGFRDREMILDIFEKTTGGRLIQNYNRIGGVQADIYPEFQNDVKAFIKHFRGIVHEYHEVVTGNVIFTTRLKGVGVLTKEDVISLGCTGGTGRASGWHNDVRKHHPYSAYKNIDFKEITYDGCDSFDRYMVRMDEIMESMNIIEQLIDNIPEGDFYVKSKPIIRVPEGVYSTSVEASRGEFGVFLESKGDKTPYRLHYRSTGLPLVHSLDTACKGFKIADLYAIGGSLDYVIPDIDR